jgi:hypothetical protein
VQWFESWLYPWHEKEGGMVMARMLLYLSGGMSSTAVPRESKVRNESSVTNRLTANTLRRCVAPIDTHPRRETNPPRPEWARILATDIAFSITRLAGDVPRGTLAR